MMPIKKPKNTYKELRQDADNIADEEKSQEVRHLSDTPVAKKARKSRDARKQKSETTFQPNKPLTITVPVPTPGWSDTFDQLSDDYGAKDAMLMILKKALKTYETELENHTAKKNKDSGMPTTELTVSTTKTLSEPAYTAAKQLFDPLDMLSNRKFSIMVATAALNGFFLKERNEKL